MDPQIHDLPDPTDSPVAKPSVTRRSRTLESFRIPEYRLFWGAMMTQMGAMNMQMISRLWLTYELTNSYTFLGLMMLANAVPSMALSLLGGVMADRIQKKRLLQIGQAASALISLGISVAILLDVVSLERGVGVGFLLIASVFQGIVMGLMMPARQAIIPELVGRERLMNAIALNAAGMNINRLFAPGLAGFLIAVYGIQTVYLATTGLYAGGLILVSMLPPTSAITLGNRGALGDVMEGLRYIRSNPLVLNLLVLTLLSVVLSMHIMILMPGFAKDIQIVEPGQYGWLANLPLVGDVLADLLTESSFRLGLLMSISGIGAVGGSLYIASMSNKATGKIFLWSILGLGISLALYAASSSFHIALLLMIAVGVGQAIRMALSNVLVQNNIDDEHRGRVMSIYMMEMGVSNIGAMGIASLSDVIGLQWAVGGTALLLVPVALFYLAFVPDIRRLR